MSVLLASFLSSVVFDPALSEFFAYLKRLLATLIGLASHCSFVSEHLVALDTDAINRDNITSLEMNHITNLELVRVQQSFSWLSVFVETHNPDLI